MYAYFHCWGKNMVLCKKMAGEMAGLIFFPKKLITGSLLWLFIGKHCINMKLHLIFTIAFVVSGFTLITAQPLASSPKPTRITARNTANGPLDNYNRTTLYYNDQNHLTGTDVESWQNGQWTLSTRTQVTPTFAGIPAQIITYNYAGSGNWSESTRETYTYGIGDLETLWIKEQKSGNGWEIISRTTKTYNTAGKYLTYKEETGLNGPNPAFYDWNFVYNTANQQTDHWYQQGEGITVSFERHIMSTYDIQGRLSTTISEGKNDNNPWINFEKREYNYTDADNQVDYVKVYDWNSATNAWYWPGVSDIGYTYLSDRTVEVLNPLGTFQHYRGTTYFNQDEQRTQVTSENWDNSSQMLVIAYESKWNYNPDGSYSSTSYATRTNGILSNTEEVSYEYQQFVAENTPSTSVQVQVFPNPTSDLIHITLPESSSPARLLLIDAYGRIVKHSVTTASFETISLSGEPAGTYFFQVEQGNNVRHLTVIRQ